MAEYGNLSRIALFFLTIVFYGIKQPWWLIPFFTGIAFDFFWASRLDRKDDPAIRRRILIYSVTQNLSLLAIYKYWDGLKWVLDFIAPSLSPQIGRYLFFGTESVLPAGISFYTFESMSFVIDVYRKEVKPPKRALEFFAFIGMFPRFIAGPIVRYKDMVGQFNNYPGMNIESGLFIFFIGLSLKSVLADSFSVFVPYAFGASDLTVLSAWVGLVSYALQIYFDFSGYSLMAIGLGRMLGFQFPTNFNRPYLATSLSDFWSRWHISFTSWIRDYLYTPLAVAALRRSAIHFAGAVVLTISLSGLWHGAGFTYIFWGLWHGVFLCAERAFGLDRFCPKFLHRILTLIVVFFSWAFFRASNLSEAWRILKALVGFPSSSGVFNPTLLESNGLCAALSVMGIIYCFGVERQINYPMLERIEIISLRARVGALAAFAAAILLSFSNWAIPFLYFQF